MVTSGVVVPAEAVHELPCSCCDKTSLDTNCTVESLCSMHFYSLVLVLVTVQQNDSTDFTASHAASPSDNDPANVAASSHVPPPFVGKTRSGSSSPSGQNSHVAETVEVLQQN